MAVKAIVGAQWGDEGKGRIVDYLAQKSDVVIRYQGGDNAGHTVINDKGKFALHIIPSGIFNPKTINIIGAGCVVNLDNMQIELDDLHSKQVNTDNLIIDIRAHLILPHHLLLDGAQEEKKSSHWKVGTTKKGIGPCYSDKAARIGLRVGDLLEDENLKTRLKMFLEVKDKELEFFNIEKISFDELYALLLSWKKKYSHMIKDTLPILKKVINEKKQILAEGQLGIMRDLDWGIYPYTTSSNPTSGGIASGSGINFSHIKSVIGVVKAYSTSVGGGPFTCELFDEDGEKLRDIGKEYGATTGRPRRCGWFDCVALNYSSFINGFTSIAITKLDVLDHFEKIKLCIAYELNGKTITQLPSTYDQERAKPIYKEFKGWLCDTSKARDFDELPENAKIYINAIKELTGSKISYISVGPERDQLIVMDERNA